MRRATYALAAYTVIALVVTWPLARGLTRDVAWDLGDSVLNMWILSWDAEQFRAILGGDAKRLLTFFDANIFHPAPLSLAYSEHLVPQALQIFPVYILTKNPILCYNLLFLSTFVLSGLGMYLLVRELTGNDAAAFVGGLLFAFAPYRIPQSSHLQVLSSQWMPFVLFGISRYVRTGRRRALAGATGALVAENLSCGYYLLYFPPFVLAYALWELWRHEALRDRRKWIDFSAAALVIAIVTVPFVVPYLRVHDDLQLSRSLTETSRLSADVFSYATASEAERFWGPRLATVFPKPEGELFPGAIVLLLASIGLLGAGAYRKDMPSMTPPIKTPDLRWRTWIVSLLVAIAILHAAGAAATLISRRIAFSMWFVDIRLGNVTQLLIRAAVAFALALLLSPALRRRTVAFSKSRGFFVYALLVAAFLSLGPAPQAFGRPLDVAAPYRFLWDHVPGFDGLRVPARYAMIVVLMLSVLGGYGAAVIARLQRGTTMVFVLAAAFLFEATAAPFAVNGMSAVRGYNTPEARLYPPNRAPAVYKAVAQTPRASVIAELPIGQTDFDVRATYYSTAHWRQLVNGYSGFFPRHYGRMTFALNEIPRHPELSGETLRELGVTHVIVHEGAYLDNEGRDTTAVLQHNGARQIFREDGDVLLALR
jgi:hypothetical protein